MSIFTWLSMNWHVFVVFKHTQLQDSIFQSLNFMGWKRVLG